MRANSPCCSTNSFGRMVSPSQIIHLFSIPNQNLSPVLAPSDYSYLYSKHFPSGGKNCTCIIASGVSLFLILLKIFSKSLFVIAYCKQMDPDNMLEETRNTSCPELKLGVTQHRHGQENQGFSIPIASCSQRSQPNTNVCVQSQHLRRIENEICQRILLKIAAAAGFPLESK